MAIVDVGESKRQDYIRRTKDVGKLINAIPICPYSVDVDFDELEHILERYSKREGGLHLNPDFQRGHVWTEEQQISYIENFIRGAVGDTGRTITFTCSDFQGFRNKDSDIIGFYVVDGLQRLTAVQRFMNDEFKVFHHIDGGVNKDFFKGTGFRINGLKGLCFNVFRMQSKKEVLDYYIAMNSGGTVHTDAEIKRVIKMRDELK